MTFREQFERVIATTPPEEGPRRALFHGARVGIAVLLAVITYALFPTSPVVEYPLYEVGSVASENVIAPFAFVVRKDPDVLRREREEVERSVEPTFTFVPSALDSARNALSEFMQAVATADRARPAAPAIEQAAAGRGVRLTPQEVEYLGSEQRRQQMQAAIRRSMDRYLTNGVAASGSMDEVRGFVMFRRGTQEPVRTPVESLTTFSGYLGRARAEHPAPQSPVADGLYTKLLTAFFYPTVALDRIATARQREAMRSAVDSVRYEVRTGERIIGAHEVVDRAAHDKLRALLAAIETQRTDRRFAGRIFGAILLNFLVLLIFGLALTVHRPELYNSIRALVTFAILFLFVLGIAALVSHYVRPEYRPELVPIAFAAIIITVLFDPRLSILAAIVLAVLIGMQSPFRGTNALFINLIGGVAAAFSVRALRRRNQTYGTFLGICAAYLLAAFAIGLTLGWEPLQTAYSAFRGAINAFISVIFAMQLLPLAEEFTGVDTDMKLLEWSDLNRPLMRKLSLEAPGTYAHTMAIANLSEAAANEIGANGLLTRVGAYYHDIGKLKKPQYFVENQPKGRNPHDKLKPTTSAAIIRNHVKEGMEMAEEYRLPKALRSFITEHHGTGQISYFLEKAKERDGGVGNPSDFVYPGPVPQSPETAIVMLADGVEAATRVINEPTPQKIRDVVEHIVRQRIEQGQLRDAPLTLRQLNQIKEQFARVLSGMHHNRIDYPASSGGITAEFDKQKDARDEKDAREGLDARDEKEGRDEREARGERK